MTTNASIKKNEFGYRLHLVTEYLSNIVCTKVR